MSRRGFTLIELLVVIAIIGILSSVILVAVRSSIGKAQDSKRLADMHQLQNALEMYYSKNGRYPSAQNGSSCAGWETDGVSSSGRGFVAALVADGDLPSGIYDPNSSWTTGCGNYNFYFYPANTSGCVQPFYVLKVWRTDTSGSTKHPSSPGWACPGRDWQLEASYVVGQFQS